MFYVPEVTARISAGIALIRLVEGVPQLLLGHPGGPFFSRRDDGAWGLPKGLVEPDELPFAAALREFAEETGFPAPGGPFVELGQVRQSGGKRVVAWAAAGDIDVTRLRSNLFSMPWPPHSGLTQEFPEVDRALFFDEATALRKVLAAQAPLAESAFSRAVLSQLFPGEF